MSGSISGVGYQKNISIQIIYNNTCIQYIFFFLNNQLINYVISRQRRLKLNEVRPTMIKDILNTDVRIIPPFPRTTSREVKQF